MSDDIESQLQSETPFSSEYSTEEEEEVRIPLKDVSRSEKRTFLFKVGSTLTLYFFLLYMACLLILFDLKTAKQIYRTFQLDKTVVPLIVISMSICAIVSFIKVFRTFAEILFVINSAIGFLIVVGVYFLLEEVNRQYYISYGHYVIIDMSCFLLATAAFTIMSKIEFPKDLTTFQISFVVMLAIDLLVLTFSQNFWVSNPLEFIQ